jgi:hypothetical protein
MLRGDFGSVSAMSFAAALVSGFAVFLERLSRMAMLSDEAGFLSRFGR